MPKYDKVDCDSFARAVLLHHDGLSWDEIADAIKIYSAKTLEKSFNRFMVNVKRLDVFPLEKLDKVDYDQHEDTGCYKSDSCLACPLPECVLDVEVPKLKYHIWKVDEDMFIRRHYLSHSCREIARAMDIPEAKVRQRMRILGLNTRRSYINSEEFKMAG